MIVQDGKERGAHIVDRFHRRKEKNSQGGSEAQCCGSLDLQFIISYYDDTRLLKFEHKMSDPNADSKRAINVSQHPVIPSIGEMAIRC